MGAFLWEQERSSSKCIDLHFYAKVIKQPLVSSPAVPEVGDML